MASIGSGSTRPLADQLAATPPQIRYLALVGLFLEHWAALESTMNHAIERGFGLTMTQSAILLPDIPVSKKIQILKTLAHDSLGEAESKHYTCVLNRIRGYSELRNIVAHHCFHPDDKSDGVMFVVVKATSRLEFPVYRWSIADDIKHTEAMRAWDKEIEALTPRLYEPTRWRDFYTALNAIEQVQRDEDDNSAGSDSSDPTV
jgi:hypothetical protein